MDQLATGRPGTPTAGHDVAGQYARRAMAVEPSQPVNGGWHIAFLPFPAHGHVRPTLPIIAELVRRGHRVTLATTEEFGPAAVANGARLLRYTSTLAGRALPATLTPEYLVREPLRAVDEALATVPVFDEHLGTDRPDLLLYDVSTYNAGRVLARKWSRPAVQLFPTFASNEHFFFPQRMGEDFAQGINPDHPALRQFFVRLIELLDGHGLGGVPIAEFNQPADEANLVFLPREFQIDGETFDDRYAFVGPCLAGGVGAPPGGDRTEPWRAPAGGVVLASLGTTSNDHPDFFQACAQAFADGPWPAVMTLGHSVDPATLGPLPANVEVRQWLPHTAVLPSAHVFISQAGMGSIMEALSFGVPLVVVPYLPEQHFIARRAEELGLARMVPPAEANAHTIRSAALDAANDIELHRRVIWMRSCIRTAGGAPRAADEIEDILRRAERKGT